MEALGFLYLIVAVVALWIGYLIAREFYRAAEAKGFSEKKYLWLCFFLGVVGYLLVIALPNNSQPQKEISMELPSL